MTGRRAFLGLCAAAAIAGRAQAPVRRLRVACPGERPIDAQEAYRKRIETGLANAGLKDVDVRCFHVGNDGEAPRRMREALAWEPDVVLVPGPHLAQVARDATTTVPIVFFAVSEPGQFDLVQSLARPGGNITGVGLNAADGTLKRLEVVRELLPRARRLGIFYRDPKRGRLLQVVRNRVREGARQLGLAVDEFEVQSGGGFRATLAELVKRPPDAVLTFGPIAWEPDGASVDPVPAFVEFERRTSVPVIQDSEYAVRAGAVVAMYDGGTQLGPAVGLVARVLKGEKPATIPVELPLSYRLAVNRGAAKALGIAIPASLLLRADLVIE